MESITFPATQNSQLVQLKTSLSTFENLSKTDVNTCADFRVVVVTLKQRQWVVLLEDFYKKTSVLRVFHNRVSFKIERDQVIRFTHFRWDLVCPPCPIMSPTERSAIFLTWNTTISLNSYLSENLSTERLNIHHSSLKTVERTHRNVCLKYVNNSHTPSRRVESLMFTTEDGKKIDVTFYSTNGNNSAGMQKGKWYTVLHTYYNGMTDKDREYSEARLCATDSTQFIPVADESNN